ncbi:MAG: M28 family peptidase, partial [Turicibacter sp.]|nr:M28 family peptidase [Turicibacter sp.]
MEYQKDLDAFYDSINVDYATYVANTLSQFGSNETLGFRMAGSKAEFETGNFLYEEFKTIGLKNPHKEHITIDSWEFKQGELYYLDQKNKTQKITLSAYTCNCIQENKVLDLVYVGNGTKVNYETVDVQGKLVLIDLDSYIGCQIGICALQAKQKGAYGIIATPIENDKNLPTDTITYENFTAPSDIPAFSISFKDAEILKNLLIKSKTSTLSVMLSCYSKIVPNTSSYNIVGEIPGKNPNELILVMAHYDGLFHNFHNGSCGCALLLSLARALIKSHYVPNKTIIFIAHSAKEWGLTDSSFNWSIGGYQQITKNHPEWAEKAFVAINLEGFVASNTMNYHHIRTSYEYQDLVQYIQKIVSHCPYKDGCLIDAPTTILSDDFSYSQNGIPSIISYRPSSKEQLLTYQTNYDHIKNNFSSSAFKYCHKLYGTFIILFDQMKVKPLNFEKLFQAFEESLDFEIYHHHKEFY